MRRSRTTHAGSLTRPRLLARLDARRARGGPVETAEPGDAARPVGGTDGGFDTRPGRPGMALRA